MLLKRNLLTILYSLLFLALFGLGFIQLVYLSVSNSENRNIIACIIILGIIIYLIAAFFIKEGGYLKRFQANTFLPIFIEAVFVVLLCGSLLYFNLDKGIDNSILIVLLLASIYLSARLLGGRLCGMVALVTGFFYILTIANAAFDAEQYINTLCFLLPYVLFLFITRVLTKSFVKSGFVIFVSYLALAVIFALAIVLNPLTCILLFGCVFSLVFGKPEEKGSIVAAGPFSAGILVFFTALFLVGIRMYLQKLYILPEMEMDMVLLKKFSFIDIAEYLLEKYVKAVNHLYVPFRYGIFPSILLFLGCTSGYYSIRKKASGIGPLCLAFVLNLTYYLMFDELGSQFYYMTYFLPVFAAYGFYNTLLSESSEKEQPVQETQQLQENQQEQESQQGQENQENQQDQPVQESSLTEDGESLPGKEKETFIPKEDRSETIKEKKAMMNPDEIPEWHVPDDYLPEKQKMSETVETEIPNEEIPNEEVSNAEISNEEVSDEQELYISDADIPNSEVPDEKSGDAVTEYHTQSAPDDEIQFVDGAVVDEVTGTGENDLEQFLTPSDITAEDENMLDLGDEDNKLNSFLDRLDISENIRRMNESAQEDIADIIEREDVQEELLSAIPTENLEVIEAVPEKAQDESHSTLPKYKKPDFDFTIEPVTQPLMESYSSISEYDEVPTIHDLEQEWQNAGSTETNSGFAYSLEDVKEAEEEKAVAQDSSLESYNVHSEEVVKKSGIGKRSYHKITIR